jgi:hypothetical protein
MSINMNVLQYAKRNFGKAAALALALTALAGCGDGRPERIPLAGTVLIDGKPLEHGDIRMHAENHRVAYGQIGPGGKFQLSTYELGDGCVLGRHPVSITASEVLSSTAVRWHAPKKYGNVSTSGIVVEVSESMNPVEIQLTWDGGKPFVERVAGGGD